MENPNLTCSVCGGTLLGGEDRGICGHCGSRPRVRSLTGLVGDYLLPLFGRVGDIAEGALCFAMTSHERKLLASYFGPITSVSLFGKYGNDHTEGVDARDLSGYPNETFGVHYSCLLFDYFTEHEKALAEAWRVLSPQGLFITLMEEPRLQAGHQEPKATAQIKPRTGYYDYIPDGQGMVSIKVGREWFFAAMRRVGFAPHVFHIQDDASGLGFDWFVGHKTMPSEKRTDHPAGSSVAVAREAAKVSSSGPTLIVADRPQLCKEYSIPLSHPRFPFRHVHVKLTLPVVSTDPRNMVRFSEHVIDRTTSEATNRIVCCAVGGYYVSNDLGGSWEWVPVRGFESTRFINSVSLINDRICLQARGLSPKLALSQQENAGLVLTLEHSGTVKGVSQTSVHQWHGSSSVDYSNGVLIFADYALNPPGGQKVGGARYHSAVFRSVDQGESWVKTFERSGEEIRHFHTVRSDPFCAGRWYLTSGDLPRETKIFVSADDGATWSEDCDPSRSNSPASRFRLTDLAFTKEGLIWGSDDILGSPRDLDPDLSLAKRSGARVFFGERNQLHLATEIGYVAQPVRSIVDLGTCWLLITQGSIFQYYTRPRVFLLSKDVPYSICHLLDLDNYSDVVTGFTYSCASRVAKDGTFFSVRGGKDVFDASANILKWVVSFD